MTKKIKIAFEVLLFVVAVIAFYQVAFLLNSVKWDMIVGYLPRRFFIGECLQNGIFPLWNPYGEGGYPLYANLISTWSPINIFTGLLTGYSNLTLHIFFIAYVYLAGLGMFKLTRDLINNRQIAFIAGIVYMLSGVFIGNAQHINIISGAAWLPWIVFFYLRASKKQSLANFLWTVIFIFLMFTDGYPAISIISAYLVAALFTIILVRKTYKQQSIKNARKWLIFNVLMAISLAVMLSGQIYSLIEVAPHINRFNEVDFSRAFSLPFSKEAFISFLLPFATVSDTWFTHTDISMANGYFGVLILGFLLTGLVSNVPRKAWFFFIIALLALAAAVGDELPVRLITYKYLPMMDKFRYPALFRVFTVFGFVIFAAFALKKIYIDSTAKKHLFKITAALAFIFLIVATYSSFHIDFANINIFNQVQESQLSARILAQSLVQILVLVVLIFVLRKKLPLFRYLILLIVVDMILSVQFNIHSTGVSKRDPVKYYSQINAHPKGFPVPSRKPIGIQTNKLFSFGPSWKNGSIFRKEVSFQGYNPFLLDQHRKLDAASKIRDNVLKNPLVFMSDSVMTYEQAKTSDLKPAVITVNPANYDTLIHLDLQKDSSDYWYIQEFSPTAINVKTYTKNHLIINLLQTDYPGWQTFIDGKPLSHFTSNHQFISTVIPGGHHTISFRFQKPEIIVLAFISLSIFLLMFILATLLTIRKHNKNLLLYSCIFWSLVIIAVIYKLFMPGYQTVRANDYKMAAQQLNTIDSTENTAQSAKLYNVGHPAMMARMYKPEQQPVKSPRLYNIGDIANVQKRIENTDQNTLTYVWSNTFSMPEIKGLLYINFPQTTMQWQQNRTQITVMKKGSQPPQNKLWNIDYSQSGDFGARYKNQADTLTPNPLRYGILIADHKKYGGGIELKAGKDFDYGYEFIAIESIFKMKKHTNAHMAVKFYEKNTQKPLHSKLLPMYPYCKNTWNKAIVATKIPEKTYKIQFFYYKPDGENDLAVDNTKILLIKQDHLRCGYAKH